MGKLEGRLVVVTGAARGQGAEEVAALAAEGAEVIATDLVAGNGCRRLDVTDPADWRALAADLAGRTVDGLVNNAGIPMRARLDEVSIEDWNTAIAVNLTGPMLGMQTLAPLMGEGSSIVNIGSVAGLTAHHAAAYTAGKWGLRGLSRLAAVEYGRRGIRVNTVHPGLIETPLMAGADPAFVNAHLRLTPLGRPGQVSDVAPLVVFLLSPDAGYLTGAEIAVDGGYTTHGGTKIIIDAIDAIDA